MTLQKMTKIKTLLTLNRQKYDQIK